MRCERGLKKFPPESQVEQEYKTGQRNVLNMVGKLNKLCQQLKKYFYLFMASLPSNRSHSWRTDSHKNKKKTERELWVAACIPFLHRPTWSRFIGVHTNSLVVE